MINVVFNEVEKKRKVRVLAFSCVGLGSLIDCVEKRQYFIGCNRSNVSSIEMLAEPSTDEFIGPDGIFFRVAPVILEPAMDCL